MAKEFRSKGVSPEKTPLLLVNIFNRKVMPFSHEKQEILLPTTPITQKFS
jgi:hypothetical protein